MSNVTEKSVLEMTIDCAIESCVLALKDLNTYDPERLTNARIDNYKDLAVALHKFLEIKEMHKQSK